MKLSYFGEQLKSMVIKPVVEPLDFIDEEPVIFLIVSKQGILPFSQSFEEDQPFEDYLFGGFFIAINSFVNEKFSEGLDRASFGEHTLLLNSVSPFFICYIFKGQLYSAQHRIRHFINVLQSDKDIWQIFKGFHNLNREIELKDIPSLEPLINDIFIDKTIKLNGLKNN